MAQESIDEALSGDVSPADSGERPSYFLESLERGLNVLECFDAQHPVLTLSEVATRLGIPRATARRVLLTMTDLGYMAQDGRNFSLTPRVLSFGFSYLRNLPLPRVAQRHIEKLSLDLGEAVSVSILDGDRVVFISRTASPRLLNMAISVGTSFPAHATSSGKVLLANLSAERREAFLATTQLLPYTKDTVIDRAVLGRELDAARERDWAVSVGELEGGMLGAAAAIRTRSDTVLGAVTVELPATRYTGSELETILIPRLIECARAIAVDSLT
ncbi:IclR family transcriptional regulator domain-containing protein [Lysinibacter cavernae]|uniref:Glycerol operon regulatory protein n=1 Tax=Lysinibacter cavernae TaxID=1640652 RepID=A0A7X5TSH2_9MICO|nr:IclR family transcriptional regulator C-terminal domain-containing protein [Lysinibacter cavernae]NIH53511.1 IclR family pca regulon transcriptional regulator [Lysinibacter cavernae]